jgi:uncharacterized membrane protein
MSKLLYIVAVILILIWIVRVFFYAVGGLIHILVVLAIIAFIIGIIRRS